MLSLMPWMTQHLEHLNNYRIILTSLLINPHHGLGGQSTSRPSVLRQVARSSDGYSWLMWLDEQPLKNAPDGQPYKKDVQLRAVIKAVLDEDKKDEMPF